MIWQSCGRRESPYYRTVQTADGINADDGNVQWISMDWVGKEMMERIRGMAGRY